MRKRKDFISSPPPLVVFSFPSTSPLPTSFFPPKNPRTHQGPGPRLPQLRLPGGRPPNRVVCPPIRDPPLGARAHRRAARRASRPDAALHSRRALPCLPAQRGRVLLGAERGGDDAVLQLHQVRAQVEGLCVIIVVLEKKREKSYKAPLLLSNGARAVPLYLSLHFSSVSLSLSLSKDACKAKTHSLYKSSEFCVFLSLSLLKVRVGPGGAKRSLSSDASDPAPADRKNRGPAAVSVCRVVILLPLLSLLRILHHLIR